MRKLIKVLSTLLAKRPQTFWAAQRCYRREKGLTRASLWLGGEVCWVKCSQTETGWADTSHTYCAKWHSSKCKRYTRNKSGAKRKSCTDYSSKLFPLWCRKRLFEKLSRSTKSYRITQNLILSELLFYLYVKNISKNHFWLTLSVVKVHLDSFENVGWGDDKCDVAAFSDHCSYESFQIKPIKYMFRIQFLFIDIL